MSAMSCAFFRGHVGRAGNRGFRPVEEAHPVVGRHAEQVADDHERERHRHRRDEVDRFSRFERGDETLRALTHRGFERTDHRGCETGLHELAIARVRGRIGVHHRRRGRVLDTDLERQDALARAEEIGVARHRDHIGVTAHRPVTQAGVPGDGIFVAESRVERERVAGVERLVVECLGQRARRTASVTGDRHRARRYTPDLS